MLLKLGTTVKEGKNQKPSYPTQEEDLIIITFNQHTLRKISVVVSYDDIKTKTTL
jgi:hypothetical protein